MSYDLQFSDNPHMIRRMHANNYKKSFLLWIHQWQHANIPIDLNLPWEKYPFKAESRKDIPDEPGVYAFCIEPNLMPNLKPCYLVYFGEAGDGKSSNTLRRRFMDYVNGSCNHPEDRPKIYTTLNLFREYISFWCVPIDKNKFSPIAVEDELLRIFIPPDNPELPADVSAIAKSIYA